MKTYMKLPSIYAIILSCGIAIMISACNKDVKDRDEEKQNSTDEQNIHQIKLLTIGSTISEIVCALGAKDQIIATDMTSTFPDDLQKLPSVGYKNSIKSEGVISTGAEIILAEESHISENVLNQLISARIPVYTFENKFDLNHTKELISEIAAILDRESAAENLIAELESDIRKLKDFLSIINSRPKVLFVYARGAGTLNIGGRGTFAEEVISLAGGELAVPEIHEFKPLTTEGLIKANPDYILFFDTGLASLGGIEGALTIPGLLETTAGKYKNIISLDGPYISGFGPRSGKAILELARLIHQNQIITSSL